MCHLCQQVTDVLLWILKQHSDTDSNHVSQVGFPAQKRTKENIPDEPNVITRVTSEELHL